MRILNAQPANSIQVKRHFDAHLHRDRLTVFTRGFEFPVLDRFDGYLVQTHTEMPNDADVSRLAIGSDHQLKEARALEFFLTCLIGILRLGLVSRAWRVKPGPILNNGMSSLGG